MFEISIEAHLDARHQVTLADGTVEDLHWHDWLIRLEVSRDGLDEQMFVCDFHLLQSLLAKVLEPLQGTDLGEILPANPTAEALAEHIGRQIGRVLPEPVRLSCVQVTEAPGCVARYRPD